MIFKTFNSDIDNISSKWGLFGKSFYDVSTDIEKRWNNVSKTLQATNDYTLQNITNVWKMGKSNPIKFLADNEVVSILDRYNKALDSGAEATARFLNNGTGNEFMDGFLKDLNGAPATMDKYKVATKNATMAQKNFSASTIATKAAVLALNVAVSMGLSIALSALIKTISEVAQSEENLKDTSRELGSELSNNASTIEDYKEKINDLKSVLSDSSSSFDDVSQARADLMVIQDELIKKFGTEKGVIEDITEAIYGQTDALDQLSKDAYYKAVDKFNQKTSGDKFVDWLTFGNTDDNRVQSNMDKMVRQMESSIYSLETTGNEVLDNLIAKSLGLTISSDIYGDGKHFTIYGELDEIQEKLTTIREMASDFDVSTGFENNFTDISNDVNSLLEAHQSLYEQYVLWEKILTDNPNNQYDEQYNLINQAKKSYDDAMKSGDNETIQKASEEYSKTLSSAIDLAMSNYDYDVASYFGDMYPDMQQMFSEWKFTLDFEPNTDGLKDKVSNSLIGLEGFSSEDLIGFNPNVATEEQINAYGELNNVASEYGLTLKGLINLLMQMGLIQSESYQQMVTQFGQDNVNKIAPEDLVFAYQIKNVGDMSFEEFQAEIQRLKDEASSPDKKNISLDSAKESVTGLAEEYTLLQEVLKDTGNVSEETYAKLVACSSKYSAAIRTENGRITLNTTKLKQVAKQRQLDTKATIKETLALKKQEWLQWRNKMNVFNNELLSSIEEKYDDIGALEAEITQYELLMNTLDQCTSAFERFKAAQQTEDQDMYNTAQDAFNVLKEYSSDPESQNYGKFNRDEFQEAALLLMDNETYRKALNAKDLEEYTGIVNDFVKEVTPLFDENNAKSASNLFDQINKILESGDVPEADVDWAERLGISQEMFHALEQLANQYDFNNKEIFDSYQLNKLDDYTEKTQAVADAEEALAAETDKTSNSYLYQSKALQQAKKEQAQFINETVSDTQEMYNAWGSQTGGDNWTTFGDYLKNQLDYDENDITGTALVIQEQMQSILDTIAQMPESADTTSMQQKYQALGDILTSLGFSYDEVKEKASIFTTDGENSDYQYERYTELLEKRKELQESFANMDSSSADFSQVQSELEGVNSQLDILREPVTIQLNADLSNVESQLQQVQAQKQEVEKSIQVSGSSASAGDFKKLDNLAVQEQTLQGEKAEIEQKLKVVAELDSSEVDGYTPNDKELPVTATLDSSAVDGYNPPDKKMTVTVSLDTSAVDGYSPSVSVNSGASSSGASNAKGTVGNAFASGYNGLPKDEKKALRSEYGQQELTVYPNGQYEITDTPTLSDLPKGTVIFNEEQTKRILKGNAHADGTVGNAFSSGTGTKVSIPDLIDVTTNNVAIKAAQASKKTADSISDDIEDTEDEFENLFDWIERRVKHFQTYFDRLLKQAETAISNSKINSYYSKVTAKLEGLTDTYGKAFNRYLQQAESSGLSKDYIKKVQTGLIDLEKINNEALSKQIENYQEFYDKAQESLDSFIENAEKLYNLPLDKAKTKIEDYEEAIDSLSKRLTNAIGAANKAEIINQSVAYSAQTVTAQQEALNTTNSNLTSARKSLKNSLKTKTKRKKSGISESEWAKIENAINSGSEVNLTYFKEGSTGYQYAVKYNEALKAQVQATKELNDANEEYITTLRESKKDIFDAYASDYENNIKVIDYGIKNLDNQITLIETAGNKASKAFYDMKKSINAQELAQYEAEKKKLEELLPTIEAGTDDYYDALDAIQGCADAINRCKENQMKFNQAIESLNTQIFEEIQDQMDRIVSEQELLAELMSHYEKFDDKAIATDEGLAILGTYVSKLNVYQTKLKDTRRELEEIYKDTNFNSDAEKLKRVQELIALEQDQLKAIDDAQEDIFGWVEDYYNAQIDAMQELVDKKKEALDLEKDLYDYQKQISEKTKDISTLEKQIAAYRGDTSEEGKAKVQKMLVELDDKRDDLQETEYEKYLTDQENMLDTMMTDFKEIISKKLEDFMTIVEEGLSVANENTSTINSTLSNFANKESYKVEFTNTISLSTVEGYLASIAKTVESSLKTPTDTGGTTGSGSTGGNLGEGTTGGTTDNGTNDSNNPAAPPTISEQMYPVLSSAQRKAYKEFVLSKGSKKLSKDIGKYSAVNQALYKGRGVVLSSSELKSLAKMLGIYRSDDKWDVNGYMYQTFKKNKLKGFKHGGIVDNSFDLLKKQVKANGDTTIVSANPGEGILTPVVTDNFIKFANSDLVNNFSPINDSLKDITKMIDASRITKPISTNNIGDVSFNFELPNVTDKESLLKEIQTDQSVQKAIQSLTIGQMMGKSRLGVRSIR